MPKTKPKKLMGIDIRAPPKVEEVRNALDRLKSVISVTPKSSESKEDHALVLRYLTDLIAMENDGQRHAYLDRHLDCVPLIQLHMLALEKDAPELKRDTDTIGDWILEWTTFLPPWRV